MSGFPILDLPANPSSREPGTCISPQLENADAHLRSTQAVNGYRFQTGDGIVGHVCDFMMDARSWVIQQSVIKTGHRFSGKELPWPVQDVTRISYEDPKQ